MTSKTAQRLLIVSNRLPLRVVKEREGTWRLERGSGGLVTALAPVLRNRGGAWIGWPGVPAEKSSGNLFRVNGQGWKGPRLSHCPGSLVAT